MRRSKIGCVVALAMALAVVTSTVQAGSGRQVAAWLDAPRHTFKKYELFSVYLFVSNSGSDTMKVPFASEYLHRVLSLRMTTSDGKELHYSRVSPPTDRDSAVLAPGDTVMFKLTPLQCFSSGGWQESTPLYIPVGTYTMSGVYWSDIVLAPITITVEGLNQAEEKIVKEYYDTVCHYTDGMARVREFEQLLSKYKETFLGARVARTLFASMAGWNMSSEERTARVTSIMEQFPESGVLSSAYGYLCAVMDDSTLANTLQDRRQVESNKYSRFMLKEACREAGKMSVYREVMGQ